MLSYGALHDFCGCYIILVVANVHNMGVEIYSGFKSSNELESIGPHGDNITPSLAHFSKFIRGVVLHEDDSTGRCI